MTDEKVTAEVLPPARDTSWRDKPKRADGETKQEMWRRRTAESRAKVGKPPTSNVLAGLFGRRKPAQIGRVK